MFRIANDFAKELLKKIRVPEISTDEDEDTIFTAKGNSIGIIDSVVAVGTEFPYVLECPISIIYPELPGIKLNVDGFFLYRKEELMVPTEPWMISRYLVDKTCKNPDEQLDVAECSILVASDIEKLTAQTIYNMEQLIRLCPTITDYLNL